MRPRTTLRRILTTSAALALITTAPALLPEPASAAVAAAAGVAWSSTWGTAQAAAVPNVTAGYPGVTIRNAVHTNLAGDRLRVHLSNRFGTAPVLMSHVTVAVSARRGGTADGTFGYSNGSVKPGTMRDVLFVGRRSVTIPAGAEAVSDSVDLAVPADQDIYVSTYTPDPSGTVTYHPASQQTSTFTVDGTDHAADLAPTGFPRETYVWHYVNGVDVSGGPGTVVALGDSITDGVTSSWSANRRWTDYLATRLARQDRVPHYGIANTGISGNRVLLDDGFPEYSVFRGSGRSALARLSYDVLDRPGVRSVIVFEGINDLQQTPHQSDPEQIIAGLAQIAGQAHDRGLRVIGATITPWQGWGSYTPQLEAAREAINTWIRSSGTFDGVADLDTAIRDPANPHRMAPTFDSGDHLHPNDAGNEVMAAVIPLDRL